jgi:hypothetical protein
MPQEKEWFEANYLDGDKIQEGQLLSSKICFEAVSEAQRREREKIRKMIEDVYIHVEFSECTKEEILTMIDELK